MRRELRNRRVTFGRQFDPAVALGANLVWRAEESAGNGSNTTALVPIVGSLSLARDTTGQGVKAPSANWSGRTVVPFNNTANRGYTGALAAPAAMTVVTVCRITGAQNGLYALTAAGVINTGNSSYYDVPGNLNGQKVATPASTAVGVPVRLVTATVVDAAGVSLYANSVTPVTAATAGALAGDTLTVGAITPGGTYTMAGEWRRTLYWSRALSGAEVAVVLRALGAYEGITIS
jgi:hypothetical protein